MAGSLKYVLRHLHTLLDVQSIKDLTDAELLERFLVGREEVAFALLVQRHGPMVLSVSRRVLNHEHDAEDVFQATFLVLAHKARSIRTRASLASWLHGVAYRLACKVAAAGVRRRSQEKRASAMPSPKPIDEMNEQELRKVLDEEIHQLPEKYRIPIVLCYFEGKSQEEAAQAVGWPKSSLGSRLVRARELLQRRLLQRGIGLSVSLLGTALAREAATAAVPALLTINTVRAAALTAAGKSLTAGIVSENASALAKGAVQAMLVSKIKTGAILLFVAGAMALGAGLLGQQAVNKNLAAARTVEEPQEPAKDAAADGDQVQADGKAGAPTGVLDRFGDPLPLGAVLRLGTIRLRHKDGIASVAFAPNGRFVATGGGDGVLCLWDPKTGRELRRLEGHDGTLAAITVSRDGKLLAAATARTVHLWEVGTGKLLLSIPADTTRPIQDGISFLSKVPLALSPDGNLLAYVTAEPSVRVWDVGAGKERFSFKGHSTPAEVLGFAGDGKTLIAAIGSRSADGEIRRWDTTTGQQREPIRVPLQPARSSAPFALSPDGSTLALEALESIRRPLPNGGMSLSSGYKVRLWDLETLKERVLTTQPDVIWSVAFSLDGKKVAGALMGGRLVVWDFATGKELQQCPGTPDGTQPNGGNTLAFSADGKVLAAVGSSTVLGLWNVATGREATTIVDAHQSAVAAVACSPDGRTIATGGGDHTIRLWDRADGRHRLHLTSSKDPVRALTYSPDGRILASSGSHGKIRLWDAATGKELQAIQAVERTSGVYFGICPVAFAPDGKTLVSWGDDRSFRMWDVTTGKLRLSRTISPAGVADSPPGRPEVMPNYEDRILAVAFTPDGRRAAAAYHKAIFVFDVVTGQELMRMPGHPTATCLAFSSDGRILVSGGWDKKVRLWETLTGQEIYTVEGLEHVHAVAFAPDDRTVAAAAGWKEGKIYLIDAATGKRLETLSGHESYVRALAFAPDGKSLVSGQRDTTALVWDVATAVNQPRTNQRGKSLESLWKDLADADVRTAHAAISELVDRVEPVVQFLQSRVPPVPHADPKHIKKLIADLDSPQFATRDLATKELGMLGVEAHPAMHEALKAGLNIESQRRVERLLAAPPPRSAPTGDLLRRLRAIQVLSRLSAPSAAKHLETLAGGAPGARETQEAALALDRRQQR